MDTFSRFGRSDKLRIKPWLWIWGVSLFFHSHLLWRCFQLYCLDLSSFFQPAICFVLMLLLLLLWWLFPCSWCFSLFICWVEPCVSPLGSRSGGSWKQQLRSSLGKNLLFFQRLQSLHMPFSSSRQTRAPASFHAWVHAVLSTQEEFEDSKSLDRGVKFSMFANPDFPHLCSCDITFLVTRVYGEILVFRQMWQFFNLSTETVWTSVEKNVP